MRPVPPRASGPAAAAAAADADAAVMGQVHTGMQLFLIIDHRVNP